MRRGGAAGVMCSYNAVNGVPACANPLLLQRKLRIGYPRAARLMDQLQEEGIVGGSTEPGKPRDVIYLPDDQN